MAVIEQKRPPLNYLARKLCFPSLTQYSVPIFPGLSSENTFCNPWLQECTNVVYLLLHLLATFNPVHGI